MESELQAGAQALLQLVEDIEAQANEDLEAAADIQGDYGAADVRDYAAIADLIAACFRANFVDATPARREGFLRAMSDQLALVADGASRSRPYDPIAITESAFRARRLCADLPRQ